MVFDVNQAVHDAVPGTIHLVDTDHTSSGRKKDIVLNPRPSSDPEDPLNWSFRRKQWNIWMVYIYIFGIAIATAVQYSVFEQISADTGVTLAQLNTGTGLMFLFAGWGCLIWQPIALVFGRRGVYVLSSLLGISCMVWTVYTTSASDWYAHRALIGLFIAPVESLPEVSVPDLFFAHERGLYVGIYALFVFGGNALAPFFAGLIAEGMGWKAAIWFGTIVQAVTTVIIFFGLEETMYFRETIEGLDEADAVVQTDDTNPSVPAELSLEKSQVIVDTSASPQPSVGQVYVKPRTYLQKLALFRNDAGRPSVKQMFIMMYRPLVLFFYFPIINWAGFLYGINLSWYNVVNATMSLILSSAPYNFRPSMVGVAFLSVFVGALAGCMWAGWAGDKIAIHLARRNKGIREPEHRLWVLLVSAFIGAAGFVLWGVGAERQIHYMGLIVGVGMVEFAVVTGGSTALAYNIDCFKEIAGESLVLVIVIRNTLGFAFNYGITPWLDSEGLVKTFVVVAILLLVCTMTFLLFIVWGKALRRSAAARYYRLVQTLIVGHH